MPLLLCRWSNGDCFVVWARNKENAIVVLDQVANPEGCPITQVQTCQVHFTLTDRGELVLDGFGEGTKEEMLSCAYPLLYEALQDACNDADYDGNRARSLFGRRFTAPVISATVVIERGYSGGSHLANTRAHHRRSDARPRSRP